jgi:hypothetical protein
MDQWLATECPLWGIHFQNWMPVAIGIVMIAILYQWVVECLRS